MNEDLSGRAEALNALSGERAYLFKVAKLQIRDSGLAEDVVQETLEAALRGYAGFRHDASLRTWLTGILRFKVIDALRSQHKHTTTLTALSVPEHLRSVDAAFAADGEWARPPQHWDLPEESQHQAEFLSVLEACLGDLPPLVARAFVLREVMEMETPEIGAELSVTANHLGVLMYRARMLLRTCLENRWFDQETAV